MTLTHAVPPSVVLEDLEGDLAAHEVIVVYGIGDGALYRRLSSWLQTEGRYLVFIEDEEEPFLAAQATPWTQDPRVRLYFYKEGDEEFFKQIAWEYVFLKLSFAAPSPDAMHKEEKMQEIFSQLTYYHRGVHLLASDGQDMGARVLKNVIANQKMLLTSSLGQSLSGQCHGIPALICGAGRSLDVLMPQLAAYRDRALIFAGGSAVAALASLSIRPHFSVHCDPAPPVSRFLQQEAFEVPHFYQSRFSSTLLQGVHGPLLWLAEGGAHPIERWIREQYGIAVPPFDGGWTVTNLGAAVAVLLGCDPIIFVGVDGCCLTEEVREEERGQEFLSVTDVAGREVLTKRDWMMCADWLSSCAAAHPETRWVHAVAGGGLEIPGVERMGGERILADLLQKEYDLGGVVHSLVRGAAPTGVTEEKVQRVLGALEESRARSAQALEQLLALWEKHYPESPLETAEYALQEIELEQEPVYQEFLEPLWRVWKWPILRPVSHPLEQKIHRLLFFKRAIEVFS